MQGLRFPFPSQVHASCDPGRNACVIAPLRGLSTLVAPRTGTGFLNLNSPKTLQSGPVVVHDMVPAPVDAQVGIPEEHVGILPVQKRGFGGAPEI